MSRNKKALILSILGILGLIIITIGVTYAFFNYAKEGTIENSITSGTITFLYTEVSEVGRGISIQDAYPMSDEIGKVQVGEGKVFDFKITSNTSNSTSIPYEVTARKKSTSTLAEEAVRIYLTEVDGNLEEEVLLDNYSNLVQTTRVDRSKYIEKTIYEGKVPVNSVNYEKNFRLRMWIDESTDFSPVKGENGEEIYPYNGKKFTLTVNVYANGKVVTSEEKELEGNVPNFNSQNYPVLTEYGVLSGISINYSEESIQRLYRVNKGKWQKYEDIPIALKANDILEAKNVFEKGIESNIAEYQITEDSLSTLPEDALGAEAYDGDMNTAISLNTNTFKMNVDKTMQGRDIEVHLRFSYIDEVLKDGTVHRLLTQSDWQNTKVVQRLSDDTVQLIFMSVDRYESRVYEVLPSTTPILSNIKYYPKLTEYGVEPGYNEVIIDYFQTSTDKLYRINEGEWNNYQDKAIRLKLGDKLEAKGIDRKGSESGVSSYTAVLPEDALGIEAYDGDKSSSLYLRNKVGILYVDQKLWNKKIIVTNGGYYSFLSINFYNDREEKIQNITGTAAAGQKKDQEITILENTSKIVFDGGSGAYVYEVTLE